MKKRKRGGGDNEEEEEEEDENKNSKKEKEKERNMQRKKKEETRGKRTIILHSAGTCTRLKRFAAREKFRRAARWFIKAEPAVVIRI